MGTVRAGTAQHDSGGRGTPGQTCDHRGAACGQRTIAPDDGVQVNTPVPRGFPEERHSALQGQTTPTSCKPPRQWKEEEGSPASSVRFVSPREQRRARGIRDMFRPRSMMNVDSRSKRKREQPDPIPSLKCHNKTEEGPSQDGLTPEKSTGTTGHLHRAR